MTPLTTEDATRTGDGEALRDAVRGISLDYMTSDKHHPGYVLIPTTKFEAICEAAGEPLANEADGRINRIRALHADRDAASGDSPHAALERLTTLAARYREGTPSGIASVTKDGRIVLAALSTRTGHDGSGGAWKLVPREPTDAMITAGMSYAEQPHRARFHVAQDVWSAMLATAPETASPQPDTETVWEGDR